MKPPKESQMHKHISINGVKIIQKIHPIERIAKREIKSETSLPQAKFPLVVLSVIIPKAWLMILLKDLHGRPLASFHSSSASVHVAQVVLNS